MSNYKLKMFYCRYSYNMNECECVEGVYVSYLHLGQISMNDFMNETFIRMTQRQLEGDETPT